MNTEDMALFRDPKIQAGVNNYKDVMANPLIQRLLELYQVELKDLTALLETTANFKSSRIQVAIISKLSNTSKAISFNTCDMDQTTLEDGTKKIIKRLHCDYWIALTRALGVIDVLPAIKSARKVMYNYTDSTDENKACFNLKNIQNLFNDIEQYFSAETVLNQFKQHEHNLNIKELAKGGIHIKIDPSISDSTDQAFDLFITLSSVLCALVHDDWVPRLANKQIFTKGSLENIGSYIDNSNNSNNLTLKLNPETAAKFKEITGWCAV